MTRIVILSPTDIRSGEHREVRTLLDAGADRFHLRKPGASLEDLHEWIAGMPAAYRDRISVHGPLTQGIGLEIGGVHMRESDRAGLGPHELAAIVDRAQAEGLMLSASIHDPEDLAGLAGFDYAFLSPVFDSISTPGRMGVWGVGGVPGDDPDDPVGEAPGGGSRVGGSQVEGSVEGRPVDGPGDSSFRLPESRACPVYALGGIDAGNAARALALGFDGLAVLGAVWDCGERPVKAFERIQEACLANDPSL